MEILKALGRPEEIAPLYHADALLARARSSLSPRVVMRGIHRWSTVSALGFALFVIGVVGYALGAALILAGVGKIFAPNQIGARVGPHSFDIGVNNDPSARRRVRPHDRDHASPEVDPALCPDSDANRILNEPGTGSPPLGGSL